MTEEAWNVFDDSPPHFESSQSPPKIATKPKSPKWKEVYSQGDFPVEETSSKKKGRANDQPQEIVDMN